jgi:hypothetical protein
MKDILRFPFLLLFLVACQSDNFTFQSPPIVPVKQQFMVFTSFASNFGLGCNTSIQRVQWPTFAIKEVDQNLTTCLPSADLYLPTSSAQQAITEDGDVVFFTDGPNIEPGINSAIRHVYYWNQTDGQIQRISQGLLGAEPDSASESAVVSADGRYICFNSYATNLVSGDTNGLNDIFLYDKDNGTTLRVQNGVTQPDGLSTSCSISRDGKFLSFESNATNLVVGDTNGVSDIFVYDIANQLVERVSVTSNELQGTELATYSFISGTGRFVVFISDQLDSDADNSGDLFLRDRQTGMTHRISQPFIGGEVDGGILYPSVDDSGRYVTFSTASTNILAVSSSDFHTYLYDRQTNSSILISKKISGGYSNSSASTSNISPDGRFVTYSSSATDLVSDVVVGNHMYVYDVVTGKNHLISRRADGVPGNSTSIIEF